MHIHGLFKPSAYHVANYNDHNRVFKLVDTCAAEFKAKHRITTRHEAEIEKQMDVMLTTKVSLQIKENNCSFGSGPNRIGQGIEFDYSCAWCTPKNVVTRPS
jgi:carbamoyl-phosphate synthase large subunit